MYEKFHFLRTQSVIGKSIVRDYCCKESIHCCRMEELHYCRLIAIYSTFFLHRSLKEQRVRAFEY